MVSTGRITSLIALCLVSTIACGFSSWIYVENNKADAGNVDVNVGNVETITTTSIVYLDQEGTAFSFNKYGFVHEKTITVRKEQKSVYYIDNSYSLRSVWKVDSTKCPSLTYEISQKYNNGSKKTFDFLPKEGTFTINSYSSYDKTTRGLSGEVSGAFSTYKTNTTQSLTYTLTLPTSPTYQYLELIYSNTATYKTSFEQDVYIPSTTSTDDHNQKQNVIFTFKLDKAGS